MATPLEDPIAVLASLPAVPFLVRLTALPRASGWRLELSEDDGTTWTSLEAGQAGHATPAAAVEAGAQAIDLWRASRANAEQFEVSHFFTSGRLERRKILILDELTEKLVEVDGYAAQAENGIWEEDVSPIGAINKAKIRKVRGETAASTNKATQGER